MCTTSSISPTAALDLGARRACAAPGRTRRSARPSCSARSRSSGRSSTSAAAPAAASRRARRASGRPSRWCRRSDRRSRRSSARSWSCRSRKGRAARRTRRDCSSRSMPSTASEIAVALARRRVSREPAQLFLRSMKSRPITLEPIAAITTVATSRMTPSADSTSKLPSSRQVEQHHRDHPRVGPDQEDRRGQLARRRDEDQDPGAGEALLQQRHQHLADREQPAAAEDAHRLLHLRIDAAQAGRARRVGDRQEARGEAEDQDGRGAVERERRRRVGGIEADRQHDAGNDERRHAEERQHVAPRHQLAADDIGDRQRQADRGESRSLPNRRRC